jgi:hypothetical protein
MENVDGDELRWSRRTFLMTVCLPVTAQTRNGAEAPLYREARQSAPGNGTADEGGLIEMDCDAFNTYLSDVSLPIDLQQDTEWDQRRLSEAQPVSHREDNPAVAGRT